MDNGLGAPPPARDGRGNTPRVIGIRRINYAGAGMPPVETASSPEDIHNGGASASEPLPEKEGECPETPSSPEPPVLNQQEIQAFYRESLLALKAGNSARKLATTTPDNEMMFYDSASSGSQATNPEQLRSPHDDRMSPRSVVSDDLKCEHTCAISPTLSVHIARATTPTTRVHSARATTPTTGVDSSRATTPTTGVDWSRATTPTTGVDSARATTPTGVDWSRATTPTTGVDSSRATTPTTGVHGAHAITPTTGVDSSRATTTSQDIPQDPINEVVSAVRETTGTRKRVRRVGKPLIENYK